MANATSEPEEQGEIEITEEMIKAVLRVVYDHAFPSVTRQAESPELAEASVGLL
jgi:hypothetical protein